MNNIDIIIKITDIQHLVNDTDNNVKPKSILDFKLHSQLNESELKKDIFNKEKNKLLLFNKMSIFAKNFISVNDYVLVKGDLRIASKDENIFLANEIRVLNIK